MDDIRHIGIFNAAEWPITLIGAGGIGALTAITLGKMGVPTLNVWDGDEVSPENVATQFFSSFDVERGRRA
jgi:tRNA A37 threonylcarbamoyladenosine dehydratase